MIGRDSAEWSGVRAWLHAEIAVEQVNLESPACGIKEADLVRGKLMAYRHLIATVEPPPAITGEIARPPGTNY